MKRAIALFSAGLLLATATATRATPGSAAVASTLPSRAAVVQAARSAVDYYYGSGGGSTSSADWRWSVFFLGALSLGQETGDPKYRDWIQSWGSRNNWNPDAPQSPESNPDSRGAIQVWQALPSIGGKPDLARSDQLMQQDLNLPPSTYWWIDAMFMGLPLWPTWAARTGNGAYEAKAAQFYEYLKRDGRTSYRKGCSGTGLFDPTQNLWWRDCLYVPKRDSLGHKVFWARGNGWVIAALGRMLEITPASDPERAEYRAMFQRMAARLIQLQGSDGMWRTSLLSPSLYPAPETSSTALITYALATGVRLRALDAATYDPAIARAWNGLSTVALHSNGFLSNCQPVGEKPGPPSTTVSAPFCVGAFALAAVSIGRLDGVIARDAFSRTVTNGLGAADVGGAWSVTSPASAYSVFAGQARVATPAGSTRTATLPNTASTGTDVRVTTVVPRLVSGSVYVSVIGRRVGSADYRLRVVVSSTGSVHLQVRRGDATGIADVPVSGLTVGTSGASLVLRLQVVGTAPTTLRAKAWRSGSAEPVTWQIVRNDATAALQQAGHVGLATYVSGGASPASVSIRFDGLSASTAG